MEEKKMLEKYDPNSYYKDWHHVRITFMQWEHVGHIERKIGGNCKGWTILEAAADVDMIADDCIYGHLVENDCDLQYDEDDDYFTAALKDKDGNELMLEIEPDELERAIVSVEIVKVVTE